MSDAIEPQIQRSTRDAFAWEQRKVKIRYKARDVTLLVSDVLAKGQPYWPVSRLELKGLRLKQVGDAMKIYVAQLYCREIILPSPEHSYERMSDAVGWLYSCLPRAFLRNEDWESLQKINNESEKVDFKIACTHRYLRESPNEEEREYIEDEQLMFSFSKYLECLPRDYPQLMQRVFGHLSTNYIYFDDTIPVYI